MSGERQAICVGLRRVQAVIHILLSNTLLTFYCFVFDDGLIAAVRCQKNLSNNNYTRVCYNKGTVDYVAIINLINVWSARRGTVGPVVGLVVVVVVV